MNELVENIAPNGKKEVLTRKQWYTIFEELSKSEILTEVLYERYGDFYFRWYDLYNNPNLSGIVDSYLNRNSPPLNVNKGFDKAKSYYEWYGEKELNFEGLKIDYSKYKVNVEVVHNDSGIDYVYNISGNVLLIKESTNEILKTIKFNDKLSKENTFEPGRYKFSKADITMTMSTESSENYKLEFSGDDLVKLGIIKK